jgi:hypothetical protein
MAAGEMSVFVAMHRQFSDPKPFYGVDRFLEWHRAGSTEHLLAANEHVLKRIRAESVAAA